LAGINFVVKGTNENGSSITFFYTKAQHYEIYFVSNSIYTQTQCLKKTFA